MVWLAGWPAGLVCRPVLEGTVPEPALCLMQACCRLVEYSVHVRFIQFWITGVGTIGATGGVVQVLLLYGDHAHAMELQQHLRLALLCLLPGLCCRVRFIAHSAALFAFVVVGVW